MANYLKGIEKGVFLMLIFYFLGLIISLFYASNPSYSNLTQYQNIFSILPILLSVFGLVIGFSSALNGDDEVKKDAKTNI